MAKTVAVRLEEDLKEEGESIRRQLTERRAKQSYGPRPTVARLAATECHVVAV